MGRERLLSVMGDLVSNGGHSDIALKCALILTKAGCCTAQVEATLRDGMIDGSHGERIEVGERERGVKRFDCILIAL